MRGEPMRNHLKLTLSFLLLFGLLVLGWGAVTASSSHASPTHVTAAASTATRGQDKDNQVGAPFIGYAGDVVTYHYKASRQGANVAETTLTPSNVNSATFGKTGFFSVDGKVDAQPLYVYKLPGTLRVQNTLFVVTEHGSVYNFDADTGVQTWKVSAIPAGETTSDNHGCSQISPEIGITGTPVIDRQRGRTGAIYFVAMSKDSSGHYHQRLHALDLRTGAELFGGPKEIAATYPGTGDGSQGGMVIFAPGQFAERAGLLELRRDNLPRFTSHCDQRPYTGWVMAYNSLTLAQTSVIERHPQRQ